MVWALNTRSQASGGLRPHDLTLTRRSLYQAELPRHFSVMPSELIKSLSELDQMKKTISGIRGIFGNDFNLKYTIQFCNNFSSLIESKKCVIGRDTRPSGTMIKETASATLMRNGINVYNLETVPTPVVFRESRKYGAGLVITSSHNPLEWNGIKFIINEIGIKEQITSSYLEDAKKLIGNIENQPEIAIDIVGGAAKEFAPNLLRQLGCKVKVINENTSNCTRGPDPTTDSLSDLIAATSEKEI